MPSTYTPRLRYTKQGDNENPNTWGDILNDQVIDLIDQSVAGFEEIDVTGSSNVDISTQTVSGGIDSARNMMLKLSGNITTDIDFIVPSVEKLYVIHVTATGGNITVKPTGGNGVTFGNDELAVIYCDGTDITLVANAADSIPVGGIMLWSGSVSSIPAGWNLCDGTNGTPDLRDKFVVGARIDDVGVAKTNVTGSLTQTGGTIGSTTATGSFTLTKANLPNESLNVSGSTNTTGSHSHTFTVRDNHKQGDQNGGIGIRFSKDRTGTTSSAGNHSHSVTGTTEAMGSGDPVNLSVGLNISPPPYFALAYIMKL